MKTVKLITCDDAFQAHVIQGALKNEGIASVLHNENMSSVMRGYVRDVTGVDIFVYEDEYDNALRLLERNQMIPEQLRYCPHCGSDEIKFVLKKSHRVRAVVAAVIAALSAAPPGTEHWEYVCRKCGTHFEKPVAKKPMPLTSTPTVRKHAISVLSGVLTATTAKRILPSIGKGQYYSPTCLSEWVKNLSSTFWQVSSKPI